MTEPSRLAEALGYIDANLQRAPTLTDIANAARLSPYHFSRLFSAAMGESPMSYVRRRRLGMAALKLVEAPHTRLVDLALDCGFESQEAFTRAFRRTFGITPGELKRRGGADRVCDEESILAARDLRERLTIRPNPARRPAFRVAGLNGRFDRMSSSAIPALWDRLVPRLPLPAQADPMTYGVCYSANWKEGRFNYVAGAAVAPDADLPPEIHLMDIPAQTYLVFDHALDAGAIHQQIVAGIVEILSNRLCAAGATLGAGPDFECYPPGFRPDRTATISYWIPIA